MLKSETNNIITFIANGNAAYRDMNYHKAITCYREALDKGFSVEGSYALANAYYRTDNIPMAMLYYEKVLKFKPFNEDVQHNIELCRKKTIDKLYSEQPFIAQRVFDAASCELSSGALECGAVFSLVFALAMALTCLRVSGVVARRVLLFAFSLMMATFMFSNIFLYRQSLLLNSHNSAIVVSKVVKVKSSPEKRASSVFVIHEGTKVWITDADIPQWVNIRLSDGREGWIQIENVEMI